MSDLAEQLAAKFHTQTPEERDRPSEDATTAATMTRLIAEVTGVDRESVGTDFDLRADGATDSLAMVEIAVRVEQECGVRIGTAAARDIRTAGELIRFVESRLDGAAGDASGA